MDWECCLRTCIIISLAVFFKSIPISCFFNQSPGLSWPFRCWRIVRARFVFSTIDNIQFNITWIFFHSSSPRVEETVFVLNCRYPFWSSLSLFVGCCIVLNVGIPVVIVWFVDPICDGYSEFGPRIFVKPEFGRKNDVEWCVDGVVDNKNGFWWYCWEAICLFAGILLSVTADSLDWDVELVELIINALESETFS